MLGNMFIGEQILSTAGITDKAENDSLGTGERVPSVSGTAI
jgi:hypothetical protein